METKFDEIMHKFYTGKNYGCKGSAYEDITDVSDAILDIISKNKRLFKL